MRIFDKDAPNNKDFETGSVRKMVGEMEVGKTSVLE
jgi:hypothetical protein